MANDTQAAALAAGPSMPPIAAGTRILLGVCGGIAAYKACELTRRLKDLGAHVRVVMTENAGHFVGATTFQALSGEAVRSSLWDESAEGAMSHIALARWAQLILIAPLSANMLAKLAHGIADDLLSTLVLASAAPLAIAPAMNQQMFAHAVVQGNLAAVVARGARLLGPGVGQQACGDVGAGRMLEVSEIIAALQMQAAGTPPPASEAPTDSALRNAFAGKTLLITAGPTYEDLDPVRYLGNRSSGKMGFAIAQAAAQAGAFVSVIAGPCALPTPPGVARIDVRDARSMHAQVVALAPSADLIIAAAAVADYRPAEQSLQKIKKSVDATVLHLVKNPDIISDVAALFANAARRPLLVGFAAETQTVLENAREKRVRKGLDYIAANHVGPGLGMEAQHNALVLIGADTEVDLGYADKQELAARLLSALAQPMLARDNFPVYLFATANKI
jgi:phosphopantothenoylcysteine decarboxylase / phosphopantothenate---cysteine ligase